MSGSVVKSLRLDPALWERVAAYAAERRWSPNQAAIALIEDGLLAQTGAGAAKVVVKAIDHEAGQVMAAHKLPLGNIKPPMQKKSAKPKPRSTDALDSLDDLP